MVLPPFKRGSELTPSDVVAGVLRQLPPVERVADSREVEVVDHPVNLVEFEPVGEEETTSPHLSEPPHVQVERVGPSSPPREQIIAQPPEPVF